MDRLKFRVWNDMQKCYSQDDHYIDEDGQLNTSGKYIIEQCTGLKDKNGNLIYEGDILGGIFENLYVHYCDVCKQFELKSNEYGCMACSGDLCWWEVVEDEHLEVTGNIHENRLVRR